MSQTIAALAISAFILVGPLFAQDRPAVQDRGYRDGVLRKVAEIVENKYVLAEKAKGFADAFRARCAAGRYDGFTAAKDFAARVSADLVTVTGDKHLNFRVIEASAAGEKAVSPLHHPVRYFLLRAKENVGFNRLDWLEPGVGYLDLRRFYSFDQARGMALAAMTFLAHAQAVIVDVRENGGGSGDFLSSYFLPYPTQLTGSYSRADGFLTESWTLRDIGLPPRTDVPLFILIGPNTFSAAEAFAYDLQSRRRATLVGEPTKGGAHSVDLFKIDDRFEFYISTARAVSPVTGGNWEGAGVQPDVAVTAGQALDRALELARRANEAFSKSGEEKLKAAVADMQERLDQAEEAIRRNQEQDASAALSALFGTARAAGLLSEFFVDVLAYDYEDRGDEKMLFAVLHREVELFPDSASACERLAAAYKAKGKKEPALRYFQRALELDPGNRSAARMIKELRK